MAEHDAFGFAGGPAGEDDRGNLLSIACCDRFLNRFTLFGILKQKVASGDQLAVQKNGNAAFDREVPDLLLRRLPIEHSDGGKMRKLIQQRSDLLQLGDVFNETELRFRDAEDERHFVGHRILAAGNVGGSEGKNRQIACKPLLAVVADESDPVAALDSIK
ncbi:MAG: hypothetical protein BWY50_01770 [Spirochaetes bacterium ADurb.Bin315]|nr:MAG: hypothetical protein BWY50_01770 [Spirochaetes bacterium ADurb.Bin315]